MSKLEELAASMNRMLPPDDCTFGPVCFRVTLGGTEPYVVISSFNEKVHLTAKDATRLAVWLIDLLGEPCP